MIKNGPAPNSAASVTTFTSHHSLSPLSPPFYVNMQVSYFEIYMDKIRDLLDGVYGQPHLDL